VEYDRRVTRVARLVAATLAVVLALFPLAMERCRTACVETASQAQPSAPSAHGCHDVTAEDDGVVATPLPRTCGHSDDGRIADSVALAVSRTRVAVDASPAVLTAPVASFAPGPFIESSPGTSVAVDRVVLPRHLPLRL
jgi:hypothetical protein